VEKVPQAILVVSEGVQFTEDRLVEVLRVRWCEIAQSVVLEPRPYLLDRIQLWGVGRQRLQ
jgi:hypothetical protein